MAKRSTYIVVFAILNFIEIDSTPDLSEDLPLSRSLGYSDVRHDIRTLDETQLSREYKDLYQDMVRASRETYEKVEEDEANLEKIVGREKAELIKMGVIDRRRSIARLRSPVGTRRVRSQASRRQKLNSQSLRSHQQHIRHAGKMYQLEMN